MPKVPTSLRGVFTQDQMIESLRAYVVLILPKFLLYWSQHKKVFEIDNSDSIDFINPVTENYLGFLPKENFLLKLDKPLTVRGKNGLYEDLIVIHDGDLMKVLFIPKNIGEQLMPIEMKKKFKLILSLAGGSRLDYKKIEKLVDEVDSLQERWDKKIWEFCLVVFNKKTGLSMSLPEARDSFDFCDLSCELGDDYFLLKENRRAEGVPLFLNGIGKLISEYSPNQVLKPSDVVVAGTPSNVKNVNNASVKTPVKPKWYEVRSSNVTKIVVPEKTHVDIKIGGEKDFHKRKPFKRTLKRKDGTFYEIDIDVIIRPEKAKPGEIKEDQLTPSVLERLKRKQKI